MSWRTDYDSGKKVYVGPYLEPGLSSDELRDHFGKYGRIEAVWVARNPAGFAFVTFEDPRDAEEACRHLDGTEFAGKRIRVEVARGPRNNNRGAVSENGSRNSYSPGYRRSPSYGRESSGYNHYHHGSYRSPPPGRDGRRYESRPVRPDHNRRDSRHEDGYYSNGAVRRSGGSHHNHASREDDRAPRKRYEDRSRSRSRVRPADSRDHSSRRREKENGNDATADDSDAAAPPRDDADHIAAGRSTMRSPSAPSHDDGRTEAPIPSDAQQDHNPHSNSDDSRGDERSS